MTANPTWDSEDDFYAEDDRRQHSTEVDMGEVWNHAHTELVPGTGWRLAWLEATGELVLTNVRGETGAVFHVELVGWAPDRAEVAKILKGAAPRDPGSIVWLRRACRTRGVAGADVTADHRDRTFAAHRGAQGAKPMGLF